MNFILANQDVIQNQISQLEDAIKQMEVRYPVSVLWLTEVANVQWAGTTALWEETYRREREIVTEIEVARVVDSPE